MKNFEAFIGFGTVAAGLVGIGYAIGTNKKMHQLSDKLDTSLSKIAADNEVYISDELIEEYVRTAVKRNVEQQVRSAIATASRSAVGEVKSEMATQIREAVNNEYSNMSNSVKKKLADQVAAIDIYSLKHEIRDTAKKQVINELEEEISKIKVAADEKFNEAVEEVVEGVNAKLSNVTKIYEAIAKRATGVDTILAGL